MTLKQHLKKNVQLAVPVMVGQLGHIMVVVADTAMVGQVGVIPLAGATFAGSFNSLLMLFGIGVSYAITPLVAALDPGDKDRLLSYLQNAMILNLLLGFLLMSLGIAIVPFLGFFGQESTVVDAAGPYLIILMTSLIPLMLFQTFRQYSEGLSNTFHPMLVSIIANLINVGLNYVFIFGKLKSPPLFVNSKHHQKGHNDSGNKGRIPCTI
jgi:MATE family multidrug resistance protein